MILCEKGCNLTLLSSELKEHKCCEALIKKLHDKTMALIASETQNTILETKILQLRDRAEDLRSGLRDEQIEHQKLHSKIIDLETNNQSLRSSLEQEKEKNEKLCAKAAKLEKDVRVLNSNAVENQALVCQLIQNNKRKIAKDMEDLERSVKKTSCVTTIRSNSVDSDSDSSDSTEIYEELSDVEQKEKSKILVAGHVKLPRRL
jgi:septal ring factor EnvC (AmiA/AmiB activator)